MTTKKLTKAKKSKRMPSKLVINIDKRSKEHHRKLKKEANKMKKLGIKTSKKLKPLSIPNLYPFKQKMLEQIKNRKETLKMKNLEKNKMEGIIEGLNNTIVREEQFKEKIIENNNNKNNSKRKNYNKELNKVLENCEILLEILDVRDPLGCRCYNVEREFLAKNAKNKVILILNKIDLVPLEIVHKWKKYLEGEFPVVLFKSNLQKQNSNFSNIKVFNKSINEGKNLVNEILESSKSIGTEKLVELIKNYSKQEGIKTSVTCGIIGYPNVGKSSIINSLKKKKSVGVSNVPGYTKHIQEIEIDSKVKVLDCPGIVNSNESEISLILKNIIKPEDVKDSYSAINEILKKVNPENLMLLYKIPSFNNIEEFLRFVAKARGKLKKGGKIDLEGTSTMVLKDWNASLIKHYELPPQNINSNNNMILEE